jgi:uncharacterized protein YybS (DUF2232 family)
LLDFCNIKYQVNIIQKLLEWSMENSTAYIYLILGLGCIFLYRVLKKRWKIQDNKKKTLFKFLFNNLNNKK